MHRKTHGDPTRRRGLRERERLRGGERGHRGVDRRGDTEGERRDGGIGRRGN